VIDLTDTRETGKLIIGDETYELPVVVGSEGERALDVTTLRGTSGFITFDPGYANTGSCQSAITFIDGEAGVLRYRGIPIEQLAEQSSFLDVAYLLIYGRLASQVELTEFSDSITHHTMLHEDMREFFGAFPKDAHPMAACSAAAGALSTFYPDCLDPRDERQVEVSVHRLLAKMPTWASYAYKHSVCQPFMYPMNDRGYVSNFVQMMFATPCEEYEPDPLVERALELLLILQADHEQNCSTSCVRLVGSSMVNLFGTIAAGISALWGPMHSGDNRAVIDMLSQLREDGTSARQFVEALKSSGDPSDLMGFGHRIYRKFDPRAAAIRDTCMEVVNRLGAGSGALATGLELEEIVRNDEFFQERGLFPNIEFYSALIYDAIGIPINMFTVLSAMGRLPGWIAHWMELHSDPSFKIGRPRQIYTGATKSPYVPFEKRG
jgi:citrate synthase